MRLRPWNKNLFGTHYGGSLYSMCDPFFVLLLVRQLGPSYVVWDKSATIEIPQAGPRTVRAEFHVPPERVAESARRPTRESGSSRSSSRGRGRGGRASRTSREASLREAEGSAERVDPAAERAKPSM